MASFSNLPNEIILVILPLVHPTDLPSFCRISKTIYDLSLRIRQEYVRFREEYRDALDEAVLDNHPSELLCEILRYPWHAAFIENLRLGYSDERTSEHVSIPLPVWPHGPTCPEPVTWEKTVVNIVAQRLPQLQTSEESKLFLERLKASCVEESEMVLLTYFPNLTQLKLFNNTPDILEFALNTMQIEKTFTRLKDVYLGLRNGTDADISVGVFLPFLNLPTVERFSLFCLNMKTPVHFTALAGSSNVTKLSFSGRIPEVVPLQLIKMCRSLQGFSFLGNTVSGCSEPDYEHSAAKICDALLANSRDSLEYLVLIVVEVKEDCLSSLAAFKSLRYIRVWMTQTILSSTSPSRFLPSSIEDVIFLAKKISKRCNYHDLILQIVEWKSDSLPNLRIVQFHGTPIDSAGFEKRQDWANICKASGFGLHLR